jgi:transcriptional regulator with XRE-family HTH domain
MTDAQKDVDSASTTSESLADRLRIVRLRSDVRNDLEFAKLAGVARSSMSQYLNGKQVPRPPVLHRLAKATGTNINWLLGISPDSQSSEMIALPKNYPVIGVNEVHLVTIEHFSSAIRKLESALNRPLTAEQRVALAVRLHRDVAAELAAKPKEDL